MKTKPQKQIKEYLDYNQCRDFLQEKYNYNERDYSKHFGQEERFFKETGNIRPPYYSVRSDKGGYYSCPINDTDTWKFYIGDMGSQNKGKEVSKKEWDIAKNIYHKWNSDFKNWQVDNPQPEYQDFWHWVCDSFEIHNGCSITFYENEPPPQDWQKQIYNHYIEEFGEGETGEKEVDLYVCW